VRPDNYVKDDKDAAPILQAIFDDPTIPVCVSALTEAELFSPPILDAKEEESIEHVLRSVSRIPLDSQIARIAGRIRSTYRLSLPDSVIAATTILTGSTLITRNTRDFKRIPGFDIRVI
jgi:predicted nucleic acid-binding protein